MTDTRRKVVTVIGSDVPSGAEERVRQLGTELAKRGWVVLTGGRNVGVMDLAVDGAKRVDGSLTIGVLPFATDEAREKTSPHVDVAIYTGMSEARNAITVLSGDVIVAWGYAGPGTASEIALALKAGKRVHLLDVDPATIEYFARPNSGVVVHPDLPTLLRALEAELS